MLMWSNRARAPGMGRGILSVPVGRAMAAYTTVVGHLVRVPRAREDGSAGVDRTGESPMVAERSCG
eukprot:3769808-Pyramimonas_sp.AAC.1